MDDDMRIQTDYISNVDFLSNPVFVDATTLSSNPVLYHVIIILGACILLLAGYIMGRTDWSKPRFDAVVQLQFENGITSSHSVSSDQPFFTVSTVKSTTGNKAHINGIMTV